MFFTINLTFQKHIFPWHFRFYSTLLQVTDPSALVRLSKRCHHASKRMHKNFQRFAKIVFVMQNAQFSTFLPLFGLFLFVILGHYVCVIIFYGSCDCTKKNFLKVLLQCVLPFSLRKRQFESITKLITTNT